MTGPILWGCVSIYFTPLIFSSETPSLVWTLFIENLLQGVQLQVWQWWRVSPCCVSSSVPGVEPGPSPAPLQSEAAQIPPEPLQCPHTVSTSSHWTLDTNNAHHQYSGAHFIVGTLTLQSEYTCYLLVRGESCSWITIKTHKVSSAATNHGSAGAAAARQRHNGNVGANVSAVTEPDRQPSEYLNTVIIISTNAIAMQYNFEHASHTYYQYKMTTFSPKTFKIKHNNPSNLQTIKTSNVICRYLQLLT